MTMSPYPAVATLPAELLANAQILPNRAALLAHLPRGKTIAEIGVGLGSFSRSAIQHAAPRHFIAIDLFALHRQPSLWGQPSAEIFGGASHLAFYTNRFAAEIAAGMMTVAAGDSAAEIARLGDKTLDIVYLDADHTYQGVKRDLAALRPKLADHAWLILNDYIMHDSQNPYGVIQATHEFMIEHGWEMQFFCLEPSMFCDVVLRPRGCAVPLRAQLEQLGAEIAMLRASRSWRWTAPLRRLKQTLRSAP
jgi:hypothetical protein